MESTTYKINKGTQDSFHRDYSHYLYAKGNLHFDMSEVNELEQKLLTVYDITSDQLEKNKFVYIKLMTTRETEN